MGLSICPSVGTVSGFPALRLCGWLGLCWFFESIDGFKVQVRHTISETARPSKYISTQVQAGSRGSGRWFECRALVRIQEPGLGGGGGMLVGYVLQDLDNKVQTHGGQKCGRVQVCWRWRIDRLVFSFFDNSILSALSSTTEERTEWIRSVTRFERLAAWPGWMGWDGGKSE